MKKLIIWVFVSVFVPNLLAASSAEQSFEGQLQKEVTQSAVVHEKTIDELRQDLEDSLASFRGFAYNHAYYEYSNMFQALDKVREAYVALRAVSKDAAQEMVRIVNENITIAKGDYHLRIADYVRMENCMISNEQEASLWIKWSAMMEEDIKASASILAKPSVITSETPLEEGLPDDFALGV